MELIDKAAVVAEIERQIKLFGSENYKGSDRLTVEERLFTLNSIKEFIETLEVKEVDLNEEIVDYINSHFHIRYDETLERGNDPLTTMDFDEIAKHFFELGIKSSKEK